MTFQMFRVLRLLLFCAIGLLAGLNSGWAKPVDLRQVDVRESLSQMGEYRFVYRVFFKLYDAALYSTAPAVQDPAKLLSGEYGVHLEFDYLREITKFIVLKSSEKILPKNMTEEEFESIRERVDRINSAYRTVQKGDSSALTYLPDYGTTLWINNESILTIPGADFARLYFRIWLGEYPISDNMRDSLLGIL